MPKRVVRDVQSKSRVFLSAIQNDEFVGVNAGISEYDFLMSTWKKANKNNGTTRDRSDKSIKKLLQKIS